MEHIGATEHISHSMLQSTFAIRCYRAHLPFGATETHVPQSTLCVLGLAAQRRVRTLLSFCLCVPPRCVALEDRGIHVSLIIIKQAKTCVHSMWLRALYFPKQLVSKSPILFLWMKWMKWLNAMHERMDELHDEMHEMKEWHSWNEMKLNEWMTWMIWMTCMNAWNEGMTYIHTWDEWHAWMPCMKLMKWNEMKWS